MDTDEVLKLRRATRDIIAISSLPSIWTHYNVKQIADSLVETLYQSLSLEFAFVNITGNSQLIQTGYSRTGFLTKQAVENLTAKLSPWLLTDNSSTKTFQIANPFRDGNLQVSFTSIGHNFKNGVLVTGASRAEFPVETDRLVLNIASNQTNVTVEQKWSQEETRKLLAVAEEKEIKLKEARENAEKAKTEAIQANELKSSFLANMSHEIRTPLGAILGFTDVLKTSNLSSKERSEYLEIITRSGQSLTKIIDDILDLSKIEAGKLEIENLPLSLSELCKEVIFMFSDRAMGKGLTLNFDDSKFPKFKINSDQVRIRQVLVNLIGNAVKFTSQGSINVSGEYSNISEQLVRNAIVVTDTGVGMPQSMSDNLFKPFTQGDNTSTRKFGGTGLGLALSKKLGNALGGDVLLVKCEENKGCTFKFEFVSSKSSPTESNTIERKQNNALNKELLKGYKVLVADDSPDNRLLMELYLKKQGATVEFAEDGEEAVRKSLHESFDAVLMDIQMPGLDGYGALAKLRKENFRKPVFALTAHAMKEERNRAIASGFVEHIPKPVNPKELIESILTHCAR